ncbi:MAG: hypothetical protein B6D64_10325 [Bacteroidetes bacterium 4484_276]|nr:MAG: hypothetical protein B6D64_10325 [Bacteroidetes bacterium 4484_276]
MKGVSYVVWMFVVLGGVIGLLVILAAMSGFFTPIAITSAEQRAEVMAVQVSSIINEMIGAPVDTAVNMTLPATECNITVNRTVVYVEVPNASYESSILISGVPVTVSGIIRCDPDAERIVVFKRTESGINIIG